MDSHTQEILETIGEAIANSLLEKYPDTAHKIAFGLTVHLGQSNAYSFGCGDGIVLKPSPRGFFGDSLDLPPEEVIAALSAWADVGESALAMHNAVKTCLQSAKDKAEHLINTTQH